jgi:ABC-type oligopeptide transport system ATPase subunit
MQRGELVEVGEAAQVLTEPAHEYTQRLLGAVLAPNPNAHAEHRALVRARRSRAQLAGS